MKSLILPMCLLEMLLEEHLECRIVDGKYYLVCLLRIFYTMKDYDMTMVLHNCFRKYAIKVEELTSD